MSTFELIPENEEKQMCTALQETNCYLITQVQVFIYKNSTSARILMIFGIIRFVSII